MRTQVPIRPYQITSWWNQDIPFGAEYLARVGDEVRLVWSADVDTSDGHPAAGEETRTIEGMTFTVLLNRSHLIDMLIGLHDPQLGDVANQPLPVGLPTELAEAINDAGPLLTEDDDIRQAIADWHAEY